jgi:hypothetical protein
MPNYLLAYHGGSIPEGEEAQAASLEAWNEWMDAVGEQLLDGGNPVGASRTIGSDGAVSETEGDRVTGYSIIEADDIDAAIELARGCPILADGGSVEVAELVDMMAFDDEDEDEDDEDDEDD